MSTTTTTREATMTDYAAGLRRELAQATEQADTARDGNEVLLALDRLAALVHILDEIRSATHNRTKELLVTAMKDHNVNPRRLYARPFSSLLVRRLARDEVGITFKGPGPQPHIQPGR